MTTGPVLLATNRITDAIASAPKYLPEERLAVCTFLGPQKSTESLRNLLDDPHSNRHSEIKAPSLPLFCFDTEPEFSPPGGRDA